VATTDRSNMDDGMAAALERITDPSLANPEGDEPEEDERDTADTAEGEEGEDPEDKSGEPDPDTDDDESAEQDDEQDDDEGEDDDSDADDDENQGADTFTVTVDGKEEQVTLDDLKRGYSGQKYVQQGMQQAAEARKQAEEVYSALMSERQQLNQLFQQAQQNGVPQPPQEPSKDLFKSDPIGYMEAKMEYDEKLGEYQQQMQQYRQVASQQTAAEKRASDAYLQEEAQKLQQFVPELTDKAKAGKLREQIGKVGTEVYGYTPEELGQVMDHRAVRVLIDAVKYQNIRKGKDSAKEVVNQRKTKVARPGAKKTPQPSRDKLRQKQARLKRSGSIEDALGLILSSD